MATLALLEPGVEHPAGPPRGVVHDLGGSGPIFGSAVGPSGRRFFSDEFRHRIIVEDPGGIRRVLGRPGTGPGEFRYPRGVVAWSDSDTGESRLYVCDSWNHRVQLFDEGGAPRGAFGRRGSGPGEFEVPSDIALVWPDTASEVPATGPPLVAVADRWNNRVQVFDADGSHLVSIGGRPPAPAFLNGDEPGTRAGFPFFRLSSDPVLWFPTRLVWRAPCLEVTGANGQVVSIDLAYAMLPDFDTWRRQANLEQLRDAHTRARRGGRQRLPGPVRAALDTELGCALTAQGALVGAVRAWSGQWPEALPVSVMEEELARRAQGVMAAWLKSSGAAGTLRLVEVVSAALAQVRTLRAREAAEAEQAAARSGQSGVSTELGPDASPASERTARLAHQLRVLRGRAKAQGRVVWRAPAADRELGAVAVAGETVAVASVSGGALWLFDRSVTPGARLALPDGIEPTHLTAGPDCGWLIGDSRRGRLVQVADDGTPLWEFDVRSIGVRHLSGMVVLGGRLLLADLDGSRLVVLDRDETPCGEIAVPGDPTALVRGSGGIWLATSRECAIREFDPGTGRWQRCFTHPLLASPQALAVTAKGGVVGAERWLGRLWAMGPDGSWLGIVEAADGQPLGRPGGVALLDGSSVLMSDRDTGTLVSASFPSGDAGWALSS